MTNPADVLTCSVCLNTYNSTTRRPFDLGCGHRSGGTGLTAAMRNESQKGHADCTPRCAALALLPLLLRYCPPSFCEECIQRSPRSFRNCPECRARASNPHANIALLRLLDAMDGTSAGAGAAAGGGTAAGEGLSLCLAAVATGDARATAPAWMRWWAAAHACMHTQPCCRSSEVQV